MTTNAPPSRNQAMDGTLMGAFSLFEAKLLQNMEDMLPAIVIAYDRTTNRAQVQPLIVMVNTRNEQIERAQIASVPVFQPGGGGFVISTPIQTGDIGWIKANDRDISFFKKNYAQAAPNTQRKHTFSDGVFIPDSFMRDVVINEEDATNLVIQNLAGTVRIAIWADKVKITAPAVILDTPLTTCTGDLLVQGNTTMEGTLHVEGDVDMDSDLNVDGDVTVHQDLNVLDNADIGGIDFLTHRHTGVDTGPGETGGPVS